MARLNTINSRELPKIGIRPIVDGRRGGIRESLEQVTLDMGRSVKQLLETEVRHASGAPVECVMPDYCIGGVAEAMAVDQWFRRQGVGATISVSPSWCYPLETMDMTPHIPKAIWGFNGTERPGAVYLSALSSAHNQLGDPIFTIYGRDVQDLGDQEIPEDVRDQILRWTRVAVAVATMQGQAYLGIGTVAMGIAAGDIDAQFFRQYLGMRVEHVDMVEILRRIQGGIYDSGEFDRALRWVKGHCHEGIDINPQGAQRSPQQKEDDWAFVTQMTMIVRDLMDGNPVLADMGYLEEALGHRALIGGFQGQRQWTDHWPNGDVLETFLNSSFDWNGPREPRIFATENDSLNAVSMLWGHLLTGRAQIFADVRTYWSPKAIRRVTGQTLTGLPSQGVIHLSNSGAAALDGTGAMRDRDGNPTLKPFWEVTEDDMAACLDATRWCAARDFFRGGGFSAQYVTVGNLPMTMIRVNLVHGLGPVLQLAEGYSVALPDEVLQILSNRTDPTWPQTWFVPRITGYGAFRDVYSVMKAWGANHCALSFGHIGADLITLAAALRIPVAMHNVDHADIFRPSLWSAYGDPGTYDADYRACGALGPNYR
ncbi:MAG: L-fucose isomerase [Sulfobacillus benefaciens]|uniref:L-fucose isomerase n=1 Tax=Sulfobacillus benefaciens TaxID=453960 RepID=A0A2T2X9E1_9FIRM|nr:MAG: L-fucose isomerase [Sulfobacillus benefaciens]